MAEDKNLLTENQMGRWAKLANIKSSMQSGMLTEGKAPVKEEEASDPKTEKELKNESVVEEETVTEDLEDLEGLGDEGEDEMLDDLGDEAPEEDMPVDEGTVEELVSAIAGAIQDVTGVEVNVEGDAGEEDLGDLEGDDFEPAGEEEDLGDDDELMEGDDVEHTGNVQDYTQTDATVITKGKPTTGGSAAGLKAGPKASEYAGKETTISAKTPRVAGKKPPVKEALVQEQVLAVRNYIISEVANRVRARAQHETQKQQLAESLADKIFAKLRNKKG